MLDRIRFRISREDILAASRLPFSPVSPRREERSALALSLLVFGFNPSGRVFQERTSTRNVSPHGCCFHLRTRPQTDTPLALRVIRYEGATRESSSPLTYQFIWALRVGEGWDVGAVALDDVDLMRLAFPRRTP